MPDFGRGSGPESLEDIARTDQLLDALAQQRRVRPADRADAELFALLEGWRDDVRGPSSTLITEDEAAEALRDGLAARRGTKGSRRGLAVVSSLAAAVLAIGGFGAVVGGAGPGDSLYGLRTAIFGEAQSVRDDRVALVARTELAEVQQLIEEGDWEQAQQKLQTITTAVAQVEDVDTQTNLIQEWNELSVKVGTRDASATLPPVAPGEPAPPPPSGVTLLELPPVTATTSGTTTTTDSTPSTETTTSADTTTPSSPETTSTSAEPPATSPGSTTSVAPVPGSVPPTSVPDTPTSVAPPITPTTTTSPVAPAAQLPPSSVAPPAEVSSAPVSEFSEQPREVVTTTTTAAAVAPRIQESATVEMSSAPAVPSTRNNIVTTTAPRQLIPLPIPGLN